MAARSSAVRAGNVMRMPSRRQTSRGSSEFDQRGRIPASARPAPRGTMTSGARESQASMPQGAGGVTGEHGVSAARNGGRRQLTLERQDAGPEGIDAAMDPVQLTPPDAYRDRATAEPAVAELPRRDDAVLSGGHPHNAQIDGRCDFRRLSG